MPIYSAAPIEAWVIDAETSQPLEGVVVTANWQLVEGSFGGGQIPKGQMMVMESVTDKNGRFYFEGWTRINRTTGGLRNRDPQIVMFKPGYRIYTFIRPFRGEIIGGPSRHSPISGQTIRLERFKGSIRDYAGQFSLLRLDEVVRDCEWKKIPQMILALDAEGKRLKALDGTLNITAPVIDSIEGYKNQCGSAREFFKAYGK
jgi:hypothetical protein